MGDNCHSYKARVLIGLVFLFGLLLPASVFAAESISSFEVDIEVNKDRSVMVSERITYDFGEAERHGIFRDIPVDYEVEGGTRSIDVDVFGVERDEKEQPYEVDKVGNYLRVKIGDPDKTIRGSHVYNIQYNVEGAINTFLEAESYDELYWNVTGNEWKVPINKAEAEVRLPERINSSDLQTLCVEGARGAKDNCGVNIISESSETVVRASSTSVLSPREGMTVAVSFPKGVVEELTDTDRAMAWINDNWMFGLPILALMVMFWLWLTRGKDPELGAIYARYEPPEGMRPTLVGTIVDEKVHDRDITAGLIYLAEQGAVKIERMEETKLKFFTDVDYKIILDEPMEEVEGVERDILEIFFDKDSKPGEEVLISDLEKSTSVKRKIKSAKDRAYKEMTGRKLFVSSPKKIRGIYLGLALLIGGAGYYLTNMFILRPRVGVSLIVAGAVIFLFSFIMPRKTKRGAEVKAHILGFKEFLSMTQKERLKFHNAPERSPEEFMEFLPYAIALGVENDWAKQFEGMYIEPPDWYSGNFTGAVMASSLADDMSGFANTAGKAVTSAAASGNSGVAGGGFSGGGFGGGGGGSW